jgi:thymidylate kinase
MDHEWTDKRMDDFAGRVDRFEANVDRRFDKVDERFKQFEDKVDRRFDRVEADAKERSANSEAAVASLGEKMDKMSRRLTGGLISVVGVVIVKLFLA